MTKYKAERADVVIRLVEGNTSVVMRCVLTGASLSIARDYATVEEPGGAVVFKDVIAKILRVSGRITGDIEVVEDPNDSCEDNKGASDHRIRLTRFLEGGSKR